MTDTTAGLRFTISRSGRGKRVTTYEEVMEYAREIAELNKEDGRKVPRFLRLHALRTFLEALGDQPWEGKTDEGLAEEIDDIEALCLAATIVASLVSEEVRLQRSSSYGKEEATEAVQAHRAAEAGVIIAEVAREPEKAEEAPSTANGYRKLGDLTESEKRTVGLRAKQAQANGVSVDEIAAEFNLSKQAVGRCRTQYGG